MDSDVAWHSRCARSGNVRPVEAFLAARAPSLTLFLTDDEGPTQGDGRYKYRSLRGDHCVWVIMGQHIPGDIEIFDECLI
jgi:hypothetical protein